MDTAQSKDRCRRKAPLRILLVDDAQVILDRLGRALQTISDVHVTGTCEDVSSAIDAIAEHAPDLIILDISLGNGSGWDVLRHVTINAPEVAVYMFSNDASETARDRFMLGGAADFFDKSMDFSELLAAIRRRAEAHTLR